MSFDLGKEIEKSAKALDEVGITLLKNVNELAKNSIAIQYTYHTQKYNSNLGWYDTEPYYKSSNLQFESKGTIKEISNINKAIRNKDFSFIRLNTDKDSFNLNNLIYKIEFLKILRDEVDECMEKIKPWVSAAALDNIKDIQNKIDKLLATYDKWDQEKL
jgi:hypothetical protein